MEESRRFQAEMRENIKQIRESNARTDAQLLKMQEQADKDREQAEKNREKDREEARKERISFNKRMAELSDSMGTLVEDMVVPNAERIASEIFPALLEREAAMAGYFELQGVRHILTCRS